MRNDHSPLPPLPRRSAHGHKRSFGECLVFAGSGGAVGAAALVANAALRSGCGSVAVAASAQVLPHILGLAPCAVGEILAGDPRSILDAWLQAHRRVVLAAGPGLDPVGTGPELVPALIAANAPLVLDATALRLLARCTAEPGERSQPLVLTPHPGEYRDLATAFALDPDAATDEARRPGAAVRLAERCRAVVVLKGAATVVSDGQRWWRQGGGGNAALATAGSGDVLTGMITGLIGQGLEAYQAARLAVHLHAEMGAAWARDHGPRGLLASDLPGRIPAAMTAYEERPSRRLQPPLAG